MENDQRKEEKIDRTYDEKQWMNNDENRSWKRRTKNTVYETYRKIRHLQRTESTYDG